MIGASGARGLRITWDRSLREFDIVTEIETLIDDSFMLMIPGLLGIYIRADVKAFARV